MMLLGGVDIGGTKCAVSLARVEEGSVEIGPRIQFPTPSPPGAALARLVAALEELVRAEPNLPLAAIGVSCGGPLDSERGVVLSPPNLPGWDELDVLSPFRDHFGVPSALQNDANAGALAEWQWGAGRGYRNIIFLTFGTGMGAGLILNGQLYAGTNDLAGEVGHIRLAPNGPVGFGKAGSFEGFCSGGGIAQLARQMAERWLHEGLAPSFAPTLDALAGITAERVGHAAQQGDPLAREVWETVGRYLGQGLALLVDILNPQRIILGSIYGRQRSLLEPVTLQVLREEAIPHSLAVCEIVPAGLGEQIGDYASLAVALHALQKEHGV